MESVQKEQVFGMESQCPIMLNMFFDAPWGIKKHAGGANGAAPPSKPLTTYLQNDER
ncbi:hypothetical protein CP488_00746 [Chthonomonas calidirosea]|nr:hypothetical protein CP488_00746 [Chthonomonas calidirosea]